jgi:predicted metal-dependent peptidase
MAKKAKRKFSTFSLSFLDIMSCGLGAVALLFLILKHDIENQPAPAEPMQAEINLLQEEITEGEKDLVVARNTVDKADDQLAEAQGRARRIQERIDELRAAIEAENPIATGDAIEQLQAEIAALEQRTRELGEDPGDSYVRAILGEGDRQYLTGLKTGGRNILILVDASGSMLDRTIVNVIRRRNMSDAEQRGSRKWQRALDTVDWIVSRMPRTSQYQIYLFNTDFESALPGTEGEWLEVSDRSELGDAVASMRDRIPAGGTNLRTIFEAAAIMSPQPDNMFLVTDGLPTQGQAEPKKGTVTAAQRMGFFREAIERLPRGVPVNTILQPMEGDPIAASAFWRLAVITNGAFMSPAPDWP